MLVKQKIIYIRSRLVLGDHVLKTVRLLQFRECETRDWLFITLLIMRFPTISLKPETIAFLQIHVNSHVLLILVYFQLPLRHTARDANEILLRESNLLVQLLKRRF